MKKTKSNEKFDWETEASFKILPRHSIRIEALFFWGGFLCYLSMVSFSGSGKCCWCPWRVGQRPTQPNCHSQSRWHFPIGQFVDWNQPGSAGQRDQGCWRMC